MSAKILQLAAIKPCAKTRPAITRAPARQAMLEILTMA